MVDVRAEAVTAAQRLRLTLAYRDVRTLAAVFVLAQLLDAATTLIALSTGRFTESNPWIAEVVTHRPLVAYTAKIALTLLILGALLMMRLRWRLRVAVLGIFAIASLAAPLANALRLALGS